MSFECAMEAEDICTQAGKRESTEALEEVAVAQVLEEEVFALCWSLNLQQMLHVREQGYWGVPLRP